MNFTQPYSKLREVHLCTHHEESTSDAFVLVEIQGTLQVKAPEY